jgi:hypothetical protein
MTKAVHPIAPELLQGFTDRVLHHTWTETFPKALQDVPHALWNESVFRWHFVKSALLIYRHDFENQQLEMQLEWNRFDLLVQAGDRNHLIEFKFFTRNKHAELDKTERGWKGGPGTKNYGEFEKCVRTLYGAPNSDRFDERRLIVVYPDHPSGWPGRKRDYRYADWYENLRPFKDAQLQTRLRPRRDIGLSPIPCDHRREKIELKCRQFEIITPR